MTDKAKSVEVYVATHKKIDFALPDYCSKIQVNAERNGQWEGYLHDNEVKGRPNEGILFQMCSLVLDACNNSLRGGGILLWVHWRAAH